MTHLYTLLVGGTIILGRDAPDVTAIAWAAGTVLALGGDDDVRAISRGDSHVSDLHGATVVPLGAEDEPRWPTEATLEIGGRADLAVLDGDPRRGLDPSCGLPIGTPPRALALVRGGRVVAGTLPGGPASGHEAHGDPAHGHDDPPASD